MRVYELLHTGRPLLLDLHGTTDLAAVAKKWADRVDLAEARAQDHHWTVPAIGAVRAPAALLVRPDGHVVWAADDTTDTATLRTALTTWFGPPLQG